MGATFAAQASCVVMVAQHSTLRSTPVPLWVGTSVCIITVIDRKPIFAYFSNKEKGPKTMNINRTIFLIQSCRATTVGSEAKFCF